MTSSPRISSEYRRDGTGRDFFELEQRAFDFDGRDVLAAAPDDVFQAIDEEHRAVDVLPHDVTRVKPAAFPGRVGRGRSP